MMIGPGTNIPTNMERVTLCYGHIRTFPLLSCFIFILAFGMGSAMSQNNVEPHGDNVCSRITSVTNVQRIPMSGVQTKRFRYMTKCSVFGVAQCSRYRIVYVNAYRELVSTQYAVRPGCCPGYVQEGSMCLEAPPTTVALRTLSKHPTTLSSQTGRAPFSGLGPRGSAGGYPIKDGGIKGSADHHDGGEIHQEGGYFEVNPDYKGPAVDKVLPLIASGVAGVITLTAVVAVVLIVVNRRKKKRNKIQPGFHDSVRFRSGNHPKPATKLEMKRVSTVRPTVQTLSKPTTKPCKASKKCKRLSRKDGPYVEIAEIPGSEFGPVTSKAEVCHADEVKSKSKLQPKNSNSGQSLDGSQKHKKTGAKRGGSVRTVPQYAVVNKLRKADNDTEELLDNSKKPKKSPGEEDNLHGAYHAFNLEERNANDTSPLYADPNQKNQGKSKSSTWNSRVGVSLRDGPLRGVGTINTGNVLALVKQSNFQESTKLFTSCAGGGRRMSSGYAKDDESENSSGYSSLRHSIEGEPDNMYGKLNHASSVKPACETKSPGGSLEGSEENDYDKLRRGPKSGVTGTKWATSGHYETLDVNES
ncbi:uncharacterized protein [Diadema setosum]|uniref:uncharacterized protein n=1 Tax=Diadema setosum TaxID=31175 RepID=UPI003B3A0B5D